MIGTQSKYVKHDQERNTGDRYAGRGENQLKDIPEEMIAKWRLFLASSICFLNR